MNETASVSPTKDIMILVVAIIAGWLGAHRMATGRPFTGLAMLALTLSFYGASVALIWAFFDVVRMATGSYKDGKGRVLMASQHA